MTQEARDDGTYLVPGRPLRRAKIAALATYVPPRVLTNQDLETMVDTTDEWILQRTGIRTRHIVDPGVATSDLAKEAALEAMLAPVSRRTISGSSSWARRRRTPIFPSTACVLQDKIGARNAWGFDLGGACSGFTYALTVASTAGGDGRAPAARWPSAQT